MKQHFMRRVILPFFFTVFIVSCVSHKTVLSNNVDVRKYKYVIFGNETVGNRNDR